jgi:mono/diheme cytochrome c family protein
MEDALMDRSKKSLTTAIAGAVALLLVLAGVGLAVVYTGAYNVAATEEHSSFGRWAFDTTFHRSVRARAADIEPPSDLGAMVERGAGEYKAMCQHCHGGPGVDRDEWANGMRPNPPLLTEEAPEWEAKEVFWLVKHGAKMTGMPAFGPTHDEETLWGIVAMVKELPAMTPERYAALGEQHGETGAHGH